MMKLKVHPTNALYAKELLGIDGDQVLSEIYDHELGGHAVVTEILIPMPLICMFGKPVRFVERISKNDTVHYKINTNPAPPKNAV